MWGLVILTNLVIFAHEVWLRVCCFCPNNFKYSCFLSGSLYQEHICCLSSVLYPNTDCYLYGNLVT